MPDQEFDNPDLPLKKSEVPKAAVAKKAAPKKAAPKKAAPKAAPKPRKETLPLADNAPLPSKPQSNEPIIDPMHLINMAGTIPTFKSDEESDSQFNNIEPEKPTESPINSELATKFPGNNSYLTEEVAVPFVRKVALKKINRFNFRLGMEKTDEDFKLVPGTGHGWMCDKKGDQFITGLDKRPDDKARLEKALRVDLGNTSPFWSTLTFQMEDKKHGQIMNFDDHQMGPLYEVIYFAMLESSMVANGLQEYSTGKKPFAEWYIENKEAEAEAKEAVMTSDIEAINRFQELSFSRRTGTAKMLGLKVWGVSDKVASQELWDHIKKSSTNAADFLKLARMRDDEFIVSVLVKNAINLNVLRRNKANDLTYANETLGPTEDHVVSKLVQPTNAPLRIAIERMVEAKTV